MHFTVISPEVSEVIPITDAGEGPREYFHCVAEVDADTRSKAKALALKSKDFAPWMDNIGYGENPFSGLRVLNSKCKHGVCNCNSCAVARLDAGESEICKECEAEYEL